jgi:hypothetical protein
MNQNGNGNLKLLILSFASSMPIVFPSLDHKRILERVVVEIGFCNSTNIASLPFSSSPNVKIDILIGDIGDSIARLGAKMFDSMILEDEERRT